MGLLSGIDKRSCTEVDTPVLAPETLRVVGSVCRADVELDVGRVLARRDLAASWTLDGAPLPPPVVDARGEAEGRLFEGSTDVLLVDLIGVISGLPRRSFASSSSSTAGTLAKDLGLTDWAY